MFLFRNRFELESRHLNILRDPRISQGSSRDSQEVPRGRLMLLLWSLLLLALLMPCKAFAAQTAQQSAIMLLHLCLDMP